MDNISLKTRWELNDVRRIEESSKSLLDNLSKSSLEKSDKLYRSLDYEARKIFDYACELISKLEGKPHPRQA